MESVTIKASTVNGTEKTLAGERKESKPTTVKEAIDKYGEQELLELAWSSHVINVQREIRNGGSTSTRKKVDLLIQKARDEKANGDDSLWKKLVEYSVIAA